MFVVNEDNSIYATRGDIVFFSVSAEDRETKTKYTFKAGDVLRIKVYGKKDAEKVVLQKDFPVLNNTSEVEIYLTEEDTKIGEVISKPVDYWYEVELNPDEAPQTIIGYNEDGAVLFKLFPEGADIESYEPDPEDFPVVDEELDMTSPRPVANKAIAKAFTNLVEGYEKCFDAVSKLHVTPQMFGAVGDGVADDTEAFQKMLESGTKVFVPEGTYFLSSTLVLKQNASLTGANRNTTVLKFADGVNGVQINHSVCVDNLTVSFSGDCAGIYMYTPDNASYALSSIVNNIRIIHDSDTNDGCAIKLVAENVDNKPNGAYNLQFSDIDIRSTVKVGIALWNKAKTSSVTDCWLTDIKFENVFIGKAETAIVSDWEDVSGEVPHTGTAPKNSGIYFTKVQAQYVEGVTKCYAKIMNAINVHFANCFPFDYFNLYPQGIKQLVFNATEKMCKVDLGDCPEISDIYSGYLEKYIAFENSSGNFMADMANVVMFMRLSSTGSIYGRFINYDKTYNNFFYKPLPMIVDIDKDNAWDKYPELVENGTIRYAGQSSSEFIIGIETETSGCQLIITQSVADAPIPVIKARLKYNGNWYGEKNFTLA